MTEVNCLAELKETVIVGTGHGNINIVIPWNHTTMPNGSYNGASYAEIGEIVSLAYFHELM